MAFESIKGAEDDENEYLIADARREKERERARKNNRYYRRKYSDEELPAVRINHLNAIRRTGTITKNKQSNYVKDKT